MLCILGLPGALLVVLPTKTSSCFSPVGISSVVVNPSLTIPLESKNLQLFCNVTGLYNSIAWLKDNRTFSQSPTAIISAGNTTVDFTPLQSSDDGAYQCVATNSFGEHVSRPYQLAANCKCARIIKKLYMLLAMACTSATRFM